MTDTITADRVAAEASKWGEEIREPQFDRPTDACAKAPMPAAATADRMPKIGTTLP